jgi:hypothetical protein
LIARERFAHLRFVENRGNRLACMTEPERLRAEAAHCLRLAETAGGAEATARLRALADEYLARARRLERHEAVWSQISPPGSEQQQPQQQQQIQPKNENKKEGD